MNHDLTFARAYEQEAGGKIPAASRPVFHLTPLTGWMNDPNGFSCYGGQYHLFYQYYPYDTHWGSMHWGHAVSHDLLRWTHLPAALAPDQPYDSCGCFSGSAIGLKDGRQLLMYTGVCEEDGGRERKIQTQCLAVGDGLDYVKYAGNPVLDGSDLPEGLSSRDFRDPKIWRTEDGGFRCVVGAKGADRLGRLLMFRSEDGFSWRFESVLVQNDGRFGRMWECPDFFSLDGKHVVLVSPQDMLPEGFEYHNGNGTVCLTGTFDEQTKRFIPEHDQAIDCGIDFYAPQTLLTPDGRRVMIGWMQNWETCKPAERDEERPWFGQMSLPRELSVRNGRLYQQPVRELVLHRGRKVEYQDVHLCKETVPEGIEGRVAELEIRLRPEDPQNPYHRFVMRFAQNEQYHCSLSYQPRESLLQIDRRFSGSRRDMIHQRCCQAADHGGEIRLRVILDRFSAEVFVNDGEQVMTAVIPTDPDARGISFAAEGRAIMDLTKYSLLSGISGGGTV